MKKVFAEVHRIFRKARLHILVILLMDIAGAVICASDPYIIGACIDELISREYRWLYIFIALQLLLIVLRTIDKFLDTRIIAGSSRRKALRIIRKSYGLTRTSPRSVHYWSRSTISPTFSKRICSTF